MNFSPNPSDVFEDWENDTAKAVVRPFVAARGPFAHYAIEDLVQECLLHWWTKRASYLEQREASPRTYMNRVLTNRLRDLRRTERAQSRRGDLDPLRLDVPPERDGERALADLLRADVPDPENEAVRSDLADRARRVWARLPPRQREVSTRLAQDMPRSRIAREVGVSRDTVYEDIRSTRAAFRDQGLDEFLT